MMLKTGVNRGFTLVEVLVATSVLGLGLVFIFQALFVSLDYFNYYSDYLNISFFLDELLWKGKDEIRRTSSIYALNNDGTYTVGNKPFYWNVYDSLIDRDFGLHEVGCVVRWRSGKKVRELSRLTYIIYNEDK
ncbi:MAG: type II secretion system protein [Candidatus Omnitrophota bacterium]